MAAFVVVLEIAEQLESEIAELLLQLVGGDMVVVDVVEVIGDVKTETEVVVAGDGIAESSADGVVDIVVVVVILVAFAMVVDVAVQK